MSEETADGEDGVLVAEHLLTLQPQRQRRSDAQDSCVSAWQWADPVSGEEEFQVQGSAQGSGLGFKFKRRRIRYTGADIVAGGVGTTAASAGQNPPIPELRPSTQVEVPRKARQRLCQLQRQPPIHSVCRD